MKKELRFRVVRHFGKDWFLPQNTLSENYASRYFLDGFAFLVEFHGTHLFRFKERWQCA